MLTHARLCELLDYDPETGVFTWRVDRKSRVKAGDVCGSVHKGGYLETAVDCKKYLLHRLAWFYMKKRWPKGDIDHRDGVRNNNRFANLREATRQQNIHNSGLSKANTSGVRGVSWNRQRRLWQAFVKIDYRKICLGYYEDFEKAVEARRKGALRVHGKFAGEHRS